jgi:predicted protein tyrosine phosphatase
MNLVPISVLTICGLEELSEHGSRGVTHVLSILDPDYPEPEALRAFDRTHRVMLRFHDAIEPAPGLVMPSKHHVETVLEFGRTLADSAQQPGHLLVHCHVGVSRSTAAMVCLLTQAHSREDEDRIFARLLELRAKAWPNSRMIAFADELLGRGNRLNAALARHYQRQLSDYPKLASYMRENGRLREVQMAEAA